MSMLAFAMFSTVSAISPNIWVFGFLQFWCRCFTHTQTVVSITMIVEELDKEIRGWGIGFLNAISTLGAATAFIMFGIVGDIPEAWRLMYVLSILQLPFWFYIKDKLPESKRWAMVHGANTNTVAPTDSTVNANSSSANTNPVVHKHGFFEKVGLLYKHFRCRFITCAIASALNGFAYGPTDILKVKYLQEEKGLTSANVASLVIFTGFISFTAFTYSGYLSDIYGRKRFLVAYNIMTNVS